SPADTVKASCVNSSRSSRSQLRSTALSTCGSRSQGNSLRSLYRTRSWLWRGHAGLPHVLAVTILVRNFALLVGFQEQHLRNPFVGVNLCRQRRGVRKLQRNVPFPLRLQRRDVDDDAAARIGR